MSAPKRNPAPPPPVDEGWWESVLAEEERYASYALPRSVQTSVERGALPSSRPAAKKREDGAGSLPPAAKPAERAEADKPAVDWSYAQKLFHSDEIVALTVTGFNRGGLLVEGDGLFGFVPLSHLVEMAGREAEDRDAVLGGYVGRSLPLKIIECVPQEGRVVFSERAAQAGPGCRSRILGSLQPGQKVRGVVTNVTDFGVFVDLGGVEGLIHISELSWGRVAHPAHIVSLGQEVEALVLEVAAERCRVALSLKRLHPNPWLSVEREFGAEKIVPATITAVLSYGAFARLDVGIEGLIHASEIPLEAGRAVRDVLHEGQRLNVRILHVDAARQRMGLSLRLHPEPVQ